MVPNNIHTSPKDGSLVWTLLPPGISSIASYFLLKTWVIEITPPPPPPPPSEFPMTISLAWVWIFSGTAQCRHLLIKVSCRLVHYWLTILLTFSHSPVFCGIYNYTLFLPVSLVIIIIIIIIIIMMIYCRVSNKDRFYIC